MLCNSDFSERLGRMGVRDFGLERGRSPLWISNHPRFHGSAWKVPALNIEPSTISWFSVESPRSGYRTIHDITVQRGRYPLWISNHPRYHGSAWKVTALNIEPSTISWFSVESHRSGYRTIHDFMVQRGRSLLWISNHPRFHGSAWKVTALDIEPSTISWFSVESHALDIEPSTISRFSVESHRSEYRTIHDFTVQRGRSLLWISNHPRFHGSAWKVTLWISNHPRFHGSAWKVPALEAVTKRAERANGGTRAACFEQPEGVHSGCGDAKPAMFTSCYSIYIHPRYEA